MRALLLASVATCVAFSLAHASETRQLGAHEHGTGEFNIVVDGNTVLIELESPGFDIVGFENVAESDAEKAAVENALATLGDASKIVSFPAAAGCSATAVEVNFESEADHDHDHGHDEDKHDHDDDHDHGKKDDHDHDHGHDEDKDDHDHDKEHAEDKHDHDHDKKEDHDDHAHDDHDHDDHGDEANHTAFHAEYTFTCTDGAAITEVAFPYFSSFPNGEKLDAQIVIDGAQSGADILKGSPTLTLAR